MSVSTSTRQTSASLNNFSLSVQKQLEALKDRGWEVTLSKHPLKPEADIVLSVENGILTYHVRIESRYNAPTDTLHGYRVEKWHSAQICDPEPVERQAHNLEMALINARDELEQLTA